MRWSQVQHFERRGYQALAPCPKERLQLNLLNQLHMQSAGMDYVGQKVVEHLNFYILVALLL